MKDANSSSERRFIETNKDMGDKLSAELDHIRFSSAALILYKDLRNDGLIRDIGTMLTLLSIGDPDIFGLTYLYGSIGYRLINAASGLKEYFIEKILFAENPFSRTAEFDGAGCLAGTMGAAVRNDLAHLQKLASLRPEQIKDFILCRSGSDDVMRQEVMKLPLWFDPQDDESISAKKSCSTNANEDSNITSIKTLFMKSSNWPDCADELAEFHRRCGSGIFAKHRAFVWRRIPIYYGHEIPGTSGCDPASGASWTSVPSGTDGGFEQAGTAEGTFVGVASPDPVRFSDLISYELERRDIIENTLHLLDGKPANNILLYGDRGTGKSTTVKALVNEYHDRGLRLVEVPKKLLGDFPLIIRHLAGRNLKFILFVDDLAFEDNEEDYTALKAMLEGGVESRPDNVVIYATSNRKHIIKEKFSDRAGLASGNADDEVRAADTMQEKLSLSDRFGMTVIFSSPDKKKYLEIVEGLAKARGIKADADFIRSEALKWEMQYNGRSPRTARQFVDWLEAKFGERD
jgi:hypothetical protein